MPLIDAYIVPHPPLIVPEIGRGEEKKIQKTVDAYQIISRRIALAQPDTIIVTTPHSILYADYIHISPKDHAAGTFLEFGAPQVRIETRYDTKLIASIAALAREAEIPAGTLGERNPKLDHATMVPLYFINQHYRDYQIVRISISGLSPLIHYCFGQCIAEAAKQSEKKVVLVASGDLSHKLKVDGPYGLAEEGPVFDQAVTEAMANGDFLRFFDFDEAFCEAAGECGLRSFLIMAGALDGQAVKAELLSYEGPFGVGYAIAAFHITGDDPNRRFGDLFARQEAEQVQKIREAEDPFVRLARQSLEHYLKTHQYLSLPAELPDELTKARAGVFVSLKMEGRLRGCIGTITPTTASVADEIIQNAVSSGTDDPRFDPVGSDELPRIVYSVDVLGKAEPIFTMAELDVKRFGVIVSTANRRGLLLPNLEGVDTPEQQVGIALQKAGISPGEKYAMERFEVVRHQ
jgi:AmmeMemoRadiSam system protein A/AmmeMemoRadiSam system protein B